MSDIREDYIDNELFTQQDSEQIIEIHNKAIKVQPVFKNRASIYSRYEDFLGRPWMVTQGMKARKFKKMFKNQDKVIYRSLADMNDSPTIFDLSTERIGDVCKKLSALPEGIAEGYIEQDNRITRTFSDALTSIRIFTVRAEKGVSGVEKNKLYFVNGCICMAFGKDFSVQLENGGLIAAIDLESGEIVTDAVDAKGNIYDKHPETNEVIKGFKTPSFDNIKTFVENLAKDYIGYISWDIALSERGPVLIGADIEPKSEYAQLPYLHLGKGRKYVFEKYMIDPNMENAERPYGTKISSITKEGIEFYWKKPELANGYEVFRGYEEDGPFYPVSLIEKRTVGTYIDSKFDQTKKEVYYLVRSYIDDNEGNRIFSARTEPKKATFIDTFKQERETTYMYSDTVRTMKAFYGWGEPSDAVWCSDNEAIATVDGEGTITAISTGECNIICKSKEIGAEALSKVVVNRMPCEPLSEITARYSHNEFSGCWENKAASKTEDAVIMMVGDMMCGKRQMQTQYTDEEGWNFNDSYKHIREVIAEADFSVGNLETLLASGWPYMTDEVYIDNKNNCNATSRYLDAVKYGCFDAVTMSNNHNCDGGTLALKETIDQVDKYKFARTGVFKDSSEKRYMIADVNGIKVGFLAYMSKYTGFNGKDADWSEEEKDTMLNVFSKSRAAKDIADCRAAGAEYVVAYMHWGAKNFRTITKKQSLEAQQVADAGVDYIVGANPHLIQVYDVITSEDGRQVPCIYSTGNFQAIMNQVPGNRDSLIMRIRLKRTKNGSIELIENNYIPCYTYTECEGGHWTPVAMGKKLNSKVKKKNRKALHDRIVNAVGNKIEEYQY